MKDSCIVLEGGGLRGAFTSGVLEYLMDRQVDFNRVVGVSAGACVGASYVSRQRGRNRKVNVEFPSDKRYMGLRHLLTTGSYFNMKFVFGELPTKLVPFDELAFYQNPTEMDVVATSLDSGKSVVFGKSEMEEYGIDKVLVASSSIPLISRAATVGENLYFDGGVSDSIPVRYALSQHERAVVVLTRPRGYRKSKLSNIPLLKLAFRKHPDFLETLLQRNDAYNETIDFCMQMEKEGRLYLIVPSPEYSIGRTEPSLEKRMALYNHGYDLMNKQFDALKLFMNG